MDALNFKGQSVKILLAMLAVSGIVLATPVLAQGGYGDQHNGSSMGDQHMDRNAGRGDRQSGDHHMDGGHWMGGYHRHHQVCWWSHHRQVCTWR